MSPYNVDELYGIAIQIENNGARFYRKAAAGGGRNGAALLARLAEMELKHAEMFEAMRTELPAAQQEPTGWDPDDQAALYLQAVADGRIFGDDPAAALTGAESMKQILDIALGLEKDSILFYMSLRDRVLPDGGEQVRRIIKQEIGHVLMLTKELDAL